MWLNFYWCIAKIHQKFVLYVMYFWEMLFMFRERDNGIRKMLVTANKYPLSHWLQTNNRARITATQQKALHHAMARLFPRWSSRASVAKVQSKPTNRSVESWKIGAKWNPAPNNRTRVKLWRHRTSAVSSKSNTQRCSRAYFLIPQ